MFLKNLSKYLFFFFSCIVSNKTNSKNYYLSIFIITHKDFLPFVTNEFYKIITDEKNSLKLNYSFDIIYSKFNNSLYPKKIAYGELSKMYYIWKNYRPLPKYIGFNHYRRYFSYGDNIPDLEHIFNNYSVILGKPHIWRDLTMMKAFHKDHFGHALDETIEIIKEIKPEYYDVAVKTMNSSTAHWFNMFIMKSEDFLEWGEFLFPILFEYDKRHNLNNDSDVETYVLKEWKKYETKKLNINYQRRLESFVAERLSNIFYNYQFTKKLEIDIVGYNMMPSQNITIIDKNEIEKQKKLKKEIGKQKELNNEIDKQKELEKEIKKQKELEIGIKKQKELEIKREKKLQERLKKTIKFSFIVNLFLFILLLILFVLFCINIKKLSKFKKNKKNRFKEIKLIEIKNSSDS